MCEKFYIDSDGNWIYELKDVNGTLLRKIEDQKEVGSMMVNCGKRILIKARVDKS